MAYPALPDRRMPYDNDGTVVAKGNVFDGVLGYISGADLLTINGVPSSAVSLSTGMVQHYANYAIWLFFPEQREVTAHWAWAIHSKGAGTLLGVRGSNDTTNGMDGTWEAASTSETTYSTAFDWRSNIRPISFTGPKRVVRFEFSPTANPYSDTLTLKAIHVYGQKAATATPDDIIYLNGNASYAAFSSPMDFGERPLGTTQTWAFEVKNASATKTANTINIQCNDADFAISADGVTWVVTINIASLAAGASSGVMYVRDTTPGPGALLGPRFARVVTTVSSWS